MENSMENSMNITMNISQLIGNLELIKRTSGDLPVVIRHCGLRYSPAHFGVVDDVAQGGNVTEGSEVIIDTGEQAEDPRSGDLPRVIRHFGWQYSPTGDE